jgi:hypothetical protein
MEYNPFERPTDVATKPKPPVSNNTQELAEVLVAGVALTIVVGASLPTEKAQDAWIAATIETVRDHIDRYIAKHHGASAASTTPWFTKPWPGEDVR